MFESVIVWNVWPRCGRSPVIIMEKYDFFIISGAVRTIKTQL
jgi:hypothetical protein